MSKDPNDGLSADASLAVEHTPEREAEQLSYMGGDRDEEFDDFDPTGLDDGSDPDFVAPEPKEEEENDADETASESDTDADTDGDEDNAEPEADPAEEPAEEPAEDDAVPEEDKPAPQGMESAERPQR